MILKAKCKNTTAVISSIKSENSKVSSVWIGVRICMHTHIVFSHYSFAQCLYDTNTFCRLAKIRFINYNAYLSEYV